MERIKNIVENLSIPEKRERLESNRKELIRCDRAMSNMTMDKKVAMYAYDIESLRFLLDTKSDIEEIKRLREEIGKLQNSKNVLHYMFLSCYKDRLEEQIRDYYKTIQIDLRNELIDQTLPEIYVSQGTISTTPEMKVAKHIIIPGSIISTYEDDYETTIYPVTKPITSARKARHFYNNISFRYLEQLTEDYSYDLEGKDLGPVKILKRG